MLSAARRAGRRAVGPARRRGAARPARQGDSAGRTHHPGHLPPSSAAALLPVRRPGPAPAGDLPGPGDHRGPLVARGRPAGARPAPRRAGRRLRPDHVPGARLRGDPAARRGSGAAAPGADRRGPRRTDHGSVAGADRGDRSSGVPRPAGRGHRAGQRTPRLAGGAQRRPGRPAGQRHTPGHDAGPGRRVVPPGHRRRGAHRSAARRGRGRGARGRRAPRSRRSRRCCTPAAAPPSSATPAVPTSTSPGPSSTRPWGWPGPTIWATWRCRACGCWRRWPPSTAICGA